MSKARCPIIAFTMYHQSVTATKLSIDGGVNYYWVTSAYLRERLLFVHIPYQTNFVQCRLTAIVAE